MSGIEVAASAAGLISLSLTLFKGCIQAFQFAETAAHLGDDAEILRCKLEWEQYRLYQWAEQVNLEERPDPRLNWTLVANILKQLEGLLTSSKEWKERYHLDVGESTEPGCQDIATAPAHRTGLGLLIAKLKPKYSSTSSRIIQESNAPIRRLQWAAIGKDKLNQLVEDIGYFNKCLHSLLESADRGFVTAALGSLLRDVIARSNVASELDIVKELLKTTAVATPEAIASAASLKKIRFILGLVKDADAQQTRNVSGVKLKLTYLKPKNLVRDPTYIFPRGREVARYKSELVLVEWRFVKSQLEPQVKSKVDQLAILLGNTGDTSFHSLHCMGVLPKDIAYQPEDDTEVCYGLVFSLALGQPTALSSSGARILTLQDLYTKTRKPSLNERLKIAQALAETVLQLHTSGWLHKGIRPDNILFVDAEGQGWEAQTAKGPYLAGYEYARPSNAVTETVPSQPDNDLYRHPSAQGPARSGFRMSFDLFATGCVLLEIALWANLKDILESLPQQSANIGTGEKSEIAADRSRSGNFSRGAQLNRGKDYLLEHSKSEDPADVAFHAGESFMEVIRLCLHAHDDNSDDEDLEIQKLVVDKLKGCSY